MRFKRRLFLRLLLWTAALTLLWAMHLWLLQTMAGWLDVGERPKQAEFIMVLNGYEDTRPFVAAALWNAGLAKHVLIAQTAVRAEGETLILSACHEINRLVLLHCGVPPSDITILPAATKTTYDEAKVLADFLKSHPQSRVIVVTSDYHTRRSRWAFARALAERAGQVSFVSAPTDEFERDTWWQDEEGFVTVVTEYLKLAFYLLWYGHLGYWLAACSGLTLVASWIRRRESLATA
jgi:uncharacterized SAM-binding protein YcdF (DUF218 family)